MATNFLGEIGALGAPDMGRIQQGLQQFGGAPELQQRGGFLNRLGEMLNPRPQQSYGGGGLWDTIGRVSDVISSSRGAPQTYAASMDALEARRQQEEAARRGTEYRNALGEWAMNPEDMTKWAAAVRADPEAALGIRKEVEGEPYTLGEGQVRFRGNREVARGPEGAPEVTVIDGIAFDRRTGQPLFESPYPKVYMGPQGSIREQPRIGLGRQPQQQTSRVVPERPQGLSDAQLMEQAHAAVRAGANVEEVFRQLEAWGVNP